MTCHRVEAPQENESCNHYVIIHLFKKKFLRIVVGPGREITEYRRLHNEDIRANVRLSVVLLYGRKREQSNVRKKGEFVRVHTMKAYRGH